MVAPRPFAPIDLTRYCLSVKASRERLFSVNSSMVPIMAPRPFREVADGFSSPGLPRGATCVATRGTGRQREATLGRPCRTACPVPRPALPPAPRLRRLVRFPASKFASPRLMRRDDRAVIEADFLADLTCAFALGLHVGDLADCATASSASRACSVGLYARAAQQIARRVSVDRIRCAIRRIISRYALLAMRRIGRQRVTQCVDTFASDRSTAYARAATHCAPTMEIVSEPIGLAFAPRRASPRNYAG
jgi:hypothetical protein